MSKVNLKKLLNCSEVPKAIIYFDRWDVCGRNLIWSSTKTHLTAGRIIHYLCYSVSIAECSAILKYDPGKKLKFYDLYTDPLRWNSDSSQCLDATRTFSHLLQLSQYDYQEKIVIVVDGVDCASKYLSETDIIRDIHELKNTDCVLQVILHCSEDVSKISFVSALRNLCPSSVTLKTSNPLTCDVLIKKKSGKIFRSTEEFSISSEFELEYARECRPLDLQASSSGQNTSDNPFETTFNLSLTDTQKRAKNKLVLPHTRIQATGSHIHYIPDAEDDWDEEDPDDDLEI